MNRPTRLIGTATDGSASQMVELPGIVHSKSDPIHVNLIFPKSVSILGRVADPNGRPVPDVEVALRTSFGWFTNIALNAQILRTRTDSHGNYKFNNVGPRGYSVHIEDVNWRQQDRLWVHAEDGDKNIEFNIEVKPSARVRGTITINGRIPDESILVVLGDPKAELLLSWGQEGIGSRDEKGVFQISPEWNREFNFVPKKRASPTWGAYRRFDTEFPSASAATWPFRTGPPPWNESIIKIDLPDNYDK
ncbi:MAG: carboxypeptidase regulatory-like domain-containing protein [Planctomycetes bacterium]|nr:carboxypeptidase regulatory-like domain-containing protein [Planctomycetota bacterium]